MLKKSRGEVALFFICLVALQTPFLSAQPYFRGFTLFRVIQTKYFEIIYPEESTETAQALAGFADHVYEEVSTRLGIDVGRRIPVAITPHVEEFNSFMNSMPYPHIMLWDAPSDPDWTVFGNALEKVFLHEMTHAVSLSTRGKALDVLHAIFGGWVYPPALNVPSFMAEGVSVSFESLDGYGRAHDPLVKQKLRQEIIENKFLSPHQISGVSDMPAAALGAWYEYGGLFSQYLQETYGMEKYAELWQALGKGFHFSFFFYNNGFYYYFKKIYGIPALDAWNSFRKSLALEHVENSQGMIVDRGLPLKPKSAYSNIRGMAAAGERLYVLDRYSRQVFIYNGEEEKTETTIPIDASAYDITVSPSGDRFLVSSYRYVNAMAEAVVTEYVHSGGTVLPGRTWDDLYRGSYFRDGVVGIGTEGYRSRLVFRTGNPPGAKGSRNEEILLQGDAEMVFSAPRPIDDTWIAFIVNRKGKRELGFYNYDTKRTYRAVTALPDDAARWEYIRYLQVSQGQLLFAYDHDDRMYKLGIVDPANLSTLADIPVTFTERDFSGAVALPVLAGDTIYYKGSFFNTDRLMRYPEGVENLSGLDASIRLEPWVPAAAPEAAPVPAVIAVPEPLPSTFYLPIKYFNPLLLWVPLPLIREDPATIFRVDGGGIYSVIIDPTESNMITLQAAMDARFMMADIHVGWSNRALGFPLEMSFSDGVTPAETSDDSAYRALRFSLEPILSHSLGGQGLRGFAGMGMGFSQFYQQGKGDVDEAYTWDFHSNSYLFLARAGVSSLVVMPWETFGQGLRLEAINFFLTTGSQSLPEDLSPRIEGLLQAAFEPFVPLRLTLYGVWDDYHTGMYVNGTSAQYSSPIFSDVSATEYKNNKVKSLSWLAGGEVEMRLFSLSVQRSISHLYVNRFLGTLAYRTALYDGAGFASPEGNDLGENLRLTQSLVFRLGAGISSAILASAPFQLRAYLQTSLKLSKFGYGPVTFTDVIAISPQFNVSY